MGNGLTNPEYTYTSYPEFAFFNKLISKPYYHVLKKANAQ